MVVAFAGSFVYYRVFGVLEYLMEMLHLEVDGALTECTTMPNLAKRQGLRRSSS